MPSSTTKSLLLRRRGRCLSRFLARVPVALGLAGVALGGCQGSSKPFAEAMEIESLDQAIGGPTANARVGDMLLRNDQMRVVIEQGDISYHPTDVGGSIIDMDLERPEREFRGGNGLDQLGQITPIANLSVAQATLKPNVRITGSLDGAEVTTAFGAEPAFKILIALTLLLDQRFTPPLNAGVPRFRLYNEYEVRPGERLLRVTTTVGFDVDFCRVTEADGCNAECDDALYDDDCECPSIPARCAATPVTVRQADPLPDRDLASILDIALGDLPRPLGSGACNDDTDCDTMANEICTDVTNASLGGEFKVCRGPDKRDAGVFLGDLLIFGGNVTPFVSDIGYDTESDIRRLFDRGGDTLAQPLQLDAVFATGDRVSYGYASPDGDVLVPIFSGPFSMGATHAASCPSSDPGCLSGVLIRFERWLSVGEGDVASAQEPLLAALAERNEDGGGERVFTGTVSGSVLDAPSGEPASGVSVYAMADPRVLPCTGSCETECPLPAGDLATWTLEQLIAVNRCRTKEPPIFPLGTASIESFAHTDPGTDPTLDGRYRMTLPAGRYVLIALDDHSTRSELIPVEVTAGSRVTASFALPEPGGFDYAIFDESGELVPGRVTVGQCFPSEPCVTDDECSGGETCQSGSCSCDWGALLPLEFGGERPHDGILAKGQTASGTGHIALPPGEYEVIFSRGPHYSIDRHTVVVEPRVSTRIDGFVRRQVDRRDWIAADFHIHSTNSMDSGYAMRERVTGLLAEDMDFLSSSDHDWLTRYEYLIEEMGFRDQLSSHVGAEITTQEYGHYVAFPLRFQAWEDGEEGRVRLPSNGAVQWRGLPPGLIMEEARKLAIGDLPVVIDIPHPYDYFDFYQLDSVTLEPTASLLSIFNTFLEATNFSGDFDAMELVNTKAYFRIRRPTIGEIRSFSAGLDDLIAQLESGTIDIETYSRRAFSLSVESIRERMHRTVEEQEAILAGQGNEVPCFCGSDGDCAAGLVCDQAILTCVAPDSVSGDPPVGDDGLCGRFRGVIDDWFNMLNRGVVRTGLSGSDVHGTESGFMRTFLRTDGTTPPYLESKDIVDAVLGKRAVVSNGPMVHFAIDPDLPVMGEGGGVGRGQVGDVITRSAGQEVTLSLRVEKADWYDVDRIEVYRNGSLIHWIRGCDIDPASERAEDDPHGHGCVAMGDVVDAWQGELRDTPEGDSWYVVLVYGLDGRSMAPIYRSVVQASLGTPEITQKIYDIIPTLRDFRNPRFPSQHPLFPFAFTNPIWVDVGGDGWTPSLPPPSWCRPGIDYGC